MKYFGTDGFRGEANITLTAMHAYKIGRFLGYYYKNSNSEYERPRIVIGKDTRRSSYMLEDALCAGITSSGADAYLLHVTTTPSVSYVVRAEDFDAGIMISASHNPFYDNGIKLINGSGHKMEDEVLELIEKYMDSPTDTLELAKRNEIGETRDYVFGRNQYMGYLITSVRRSFKNKKIGLDCANGASFAIAKHVFDALGAETYVIHDDPDGQNINVECGSTHIDDLVELVKTEKLDVGFAFDGDADRCIAVDNKGNIVDGDAILYIAAKYLKDKGYLINNTVVTTVMSNMGLYKALEKLGIDSVQTKVGDKYVYQNMLETGNCLGGEQSGHIIFSKYATTGDGILTALRVMEIVMESKTDLYTLHKDLKPYPQYLLNARVRSKEETLNNPKVVEAIEEAKLKLSESGRLLVRPSGTEPVIRIMSEATSETLAKSSVDEVYAVIEKEGLLRD